MFQLYDITCFLQNLKKINLVLILIAVLGDLNVTGSIQHYFRHFLINVSDPVNYLYNSNSLPNANPIPYGLSSHVNPMSYMADVGHGIEYNTHNEKLCFMTYDTYHAGLRNRTSP